MQQLSSTHIRVATVRLPLHLLTYLEDDWLRLAGLWIAAACPEVGRGACLPIVGPARVRQSEHARPGGGHTYSREQDTDRQLHLPSIRCAATGDAGALQLRGAAVISRDETGK